MRINTTIFSFSPAMMGYFIPHVTNQKFMQSLVCGFRMKVLADGVHLQ